MVLGYRGKGGTFAFLPRHWVHFIFKLNFNHKIYKCFHSVFTREEPGEFDHIFKCSCSKGLKILCSFNLLLYLQSLALQNREPPDKDGMLRVHRELQDPSDVQSCSYITLYGEIRVQKNTPRAMTARLVTKY